MLNNLGFPEVVLLGLVGLFVFGPERLPTVLRDAAKTIRTLRQMAQQATDEIKSELAPELQGLSLADMHPRALVKKHLIDPAFLEDEIADVTKALKGGAADLRGSTTEAKASVTDSVQVSMTKPALPTPPATSVSAPRTGAPSYDLDAT